MIMLRGGQVTVAEAAVLAGVSRQRVFVWCKTAGIDPKAARQQWLAKHLRRIERRTQ